MVLPSFGARRVIVALLLAGSVAAGAMVALELPRLATRGMLLPADHPVVLANEQIAATFGMQNPIVWVVAARRGDIWQRSLLARVQSMTRDVFTIPGVVGPEIVSIASPNVRDFQSEDGLLRAVYLMGAVPDTPAAINALRRRVEEDPIYRGTLVSVDGRAAMVVADIQPDADGAVVAAAAETIRDRYRDDLADVYVTGAPVIAAGLARSEWRMIGMLLFILGTGAAVLAILAGARVSAAAGAAALLAVLWALAASLAFDFMLLPWILYGVLPAALIAPALAIGGERDPRRRAIVIAALVIGFAGVAFTDDVPARTLGVAGVLGVIAAFVVGGLVRESFSGRTLPLGPSPRLRSVTLALVLLASIGILRASVSLQSFGEGVRYLPATASADLVGVARYFPPPATLALRLHGEPGFVSSPRVLTAIDAWVEDMRDDPVVVRAMSLTDLVEMVHRAFNDDQPDLAPLPEDAALISRYLTLAYSPGFRHFLDRSFSQTAVWAYLSSDRPADIARVEATLSAAMAAHPVASVTVGPVAGDAAIQLVLWNMLRAMMERGVVAFLLAGIFVAVCAGAGVGLRFVLGGACAGVCMGGLLGWFNLPIDVVTFPAIVGGIVAGAAYAALGLSSSLAFAFLAMAGACVSVTLVGGGMLGAVTAILLLAALALDGCLPGSDSPAAA